MRAGGSHGEELYRKRTTPPAISDESTQSDIQLIEVDLTPKEENEDGGLCNEVNMPREPLLQKGQYKTVGAIEGGRCPHFLTRAFSQSSSRKMFGWTGSELLKEVISRDLSF